MGPKVNDACPPKGGRGRSETDGRGQGRGPRRRGLERGHHQPGDSRSPQKPPEARRQGRLPTQSLGRERGPARLRSEFCPLELSFKPPGVWTFVMGAPATKTPFSQGPPPPRAGQISPPVLVTHPLLQVGTEAQRREGKWGSCLRLPRFLPG